jgi:hypothetical protein
VTDATVILLAVAPALLVGCAVLWFERWRVANDWRYNAVPWRRRRQAA